MKRVKRDFYDPAGAGAEEGMRSALVHPQHKAENIPMAPIKRFLKNETGSTAVEYSLLAALIAVVIITAVSTLGSNVNDNYQSVVSQFGPAGS